MILAKSSTNVLRKFILSKKNCITLLLINMGIYVMDLVISASIKIPYFEIMWLRILRYDTSKMLFLGLREMPYFLHLSKIYLKCCMWPTLFFE
jgi:hypothetical protein